MSESLYQETCLTQESVTTTCWDLCFYSGWAPAPCKPHVPTNLFFKSDASVFLGSIVCPRTTVNKIKLLEYNFKDICRCVERLYFPNLHVV